MGSLFLTVSCRNTNSVNQPDANLNTIQDNQDPTNPPPASNNNNKISIFYNIPPSLSNFSGVIPIGFGVPFAEGTFSKEELVQVINNDLEVMSSSIEINALYPSKEYIKWLFVETLVEFTNGVGEEIFLQIGEGEKAILNPVVFPPTIDSNQATFNERGGIFSIETSTGDHSENSNLGVILEKENALYDQYRVEGNFGEQNLGEYSTRYRVYKNISLKKITHSFTWNNMDGISLKSIKFQADQLPNTFSSSIGLDSSAVNATDGISLLQDNYNSVSGSYVGSKLDGWINQKNTISSKTISWRYPWQNYLNKVVMSNNQPTIELFSMSAPSLFTPAEVAANSDIANFTSSLWDIPNGTFAGKPVTPAGLSKTYELSIWEGNNILAEDANELLQNPIYGYVDPEFNIKSKLPYPMTKKGINQKLDNVLSAAFDWVTRVKKKDSRYGFWNFGEIPYDWRKSFMGSPTYRYWMNHGQSWGTSPWALWMRSGERKYIEVGESHSRHAMDLDIAKVNNWKPNAYKKRRGGLHVYSPLPGAYNGGKIADKTGGYEYLSYAFYLTNFDRAYEIQSIMAESLIKFDHDTYLAPILDNPKKANREYYRPLADLINNYEVTLDERLKEHAYKYLDMIELAQEQSGWLPGIKSPHYLSEGLNSALRSLPERKTQIETILKNFINFKGTSLHPSSTGNIEGSFSLQTYYNLAQGENKVKFYNYISNRARAQYYGFYQSNNEWSGISAFPSFTYELIFKDWLIASTLDPEGSEKSLLPVSHINGNLNGPNLHTAYFLIEENSTQEVPVQFHFHLPPSGNSSDSSTEIGVKVYTSNNQLIDQFNFTATKHTFENQGIAYFTKNIENLNGPGTYRTDFSLPSQPVGVSIQMEPKLVHQINPNKFYAIIAGDRAGSFYFKTKNGSSTSLEVAYNTYSGKNIIRDKDKKILCESKLFNILQNGQEQGEACEFSTHQSSIVEALVNIGRMGETIELTNTHPFISTAQEKWFNPFE